MRGQGIGRRLKRRSRVALLAAILPWQSGELPLVLVGMTVNAAGEFDSELSLGAGWYVARCALYRRVGRGQGKPGLRVVSGREC